MIRALLCDLDDTLFDHAGATRDALAVVQATDAALAGWTLDEFDRRHRVVLEHLHTRVLADEYSVDDARVVRFQRLLADAGELAPDPDRLERLSWAYRHAYEAAWRLVPGAASMLSAARAVGWTPVVVTNNASQEQWLKVERCGLAPLIADMITSEAFGAAKPDPRIMTHAVDCVRGAREHAVVLGDSLSTDVAGARAAGVAVVWFNRWQATVVDATLRTVTALEPAAHVLEAFDRAVADQLASR